MNDADITDISDDIDKFKGIHVLANLQRALDEAGEIERIATLEMICFALDDLRQGAPQPYLFDLVDEALFWAGLAPTVELEAYLAAIDKRLGETAIHTKMRKRIVADMFAGMSERDQAGFLVWAAKKMEDGK